MKLFNFLKEREAKRNEKRARIRAAEKKLARAHAQLEVATEQQERCADCVRRSIRPLAS